MSDRAAELIRHTEDLIESIKELRGALLEYQRGCERLLKAGESGGSGRSTVETVDLFKFAEKRERVAETLSDFETTRRRARVGLIAVAEEEGSSLSEVARTLHVSRQLLSRQAIEGWQDVP
jgi:hypothetical protein